MKFDTSHPCGHIKRGKRLMSNGIEKVNSLKAGPLLYTGENPDFPTPLHWGGNAEGGRG
jgi:hypothetical protein